MRKSQCFLLWRFIIVLAVCVSGSVFAQLADITQPGDPIVGSSNNNPGSEGVANTIDNQPTKYLNFDKLNTGFTVTPRVGLSVVQCVTLTSANDAPERDPAAVTLEGSYDGTNFVFITSNAVPPFPSRFNKQTIRFENNTPYLSYRVIFPTVANPTAANSMQIAEVELLGFLAPGDVTQPGDPIVGSSNNNPGSEGVANVIDNQPTKYLNFDRLNTGFTVTPAVGGTLVSGITLTSANDAPERDPSSFILSGSLDGTNFYQIASNTVPAFPSRFYKSYLFFPNARAYKAYRLIFPTVAGPGGNSMQISEVELLGTVADLPQDVTQPGDPIVGSSNNNPGSEGVANVIDNQPTKYLNFDRLNTGFTVTPRSGLTLVSGLTLTSANDAPERDPSSFTLSGSYDGSNFVLIASNTVPAFAARFQKQTFLFDNNVPYLQYQVIFPTVAGPGGNSMQISEVELLGTLAPTDVTVPGDPIVPSSNNAPGSEGVANAIDNQPTKYLNFDRLNTGFTVTPGVGDTIVSGLTLTSANDAPERDPASYDLRGSNDGSNFVAISSGTVPAFPSRFYKRYIFFPQNTKSFKSYRLIFPTVAGPGGNSMQISEVEFLGVTPGVVNTNPVENLINRQPQDTPVLLGASATFRVGLTGPWKVQWYRNGTNAIAGANNATYTIASASTNDDGAVFNAVVQGPSGRQVSDRATLSIFNPSATKSIGINWQGSGANGAPTATLPTDITGFFPQAYWNNLAGGSGGPSAATNSDNASSPITIQWATSGEWGVGTGNTDPTERLLNGIATGTKTAAPGDSVTLANVPAGNHSLLLYTVQVPAEFFNMDFTVTTHASNGTDVVQRRFIRPQNSTEYNAAPGFVLVTGTNAAGRSVGNMMRFDNLQPGPDGQIVINFFAPGRAQPAGQDPIRGPGLNGLQLVLNAPPVPAPPVITQQPVSANGITNGQASFSVQASGTNLIYQWNKNGQPIQGATNSSLTLFLLDTNDIANYTVAIRNAAGRVVSRPAQLNVLTSDQITAGLITYFKFDDDDVIATNSAPGGRNGAVLGSSLPDWPSGQFGRALLFDGNTYVILSTYPKFTGPLTVSAWINSSSPDWGPIVNDWVSTNTLGARGQFLVEVGGGTAVTPSGRIEVGNNSFFASGTVSPPPNTWHHMAFTANGLAVSLYWDGQLIGTADYGGAINQPAHPWLAVGADVGSTDTNAVPQRRFNGLIDDLAIWNRSLSDIELQAIYTGGVAGQNLTQIAPVITTAPRLNFARTGPLTPPRKGTNVTLSWPLSTTGFVLQSKATIASTTWTNVPGVVSNSITLSNQAGAGIFRLFKP